MGWLERIERAVRTEVATTRSRPLIGRVAGPPAPAEQRFGLSQLMEMFSYQGVGYSVYGGDNQNRERDTTSFTRYVGEFYRDNGIIFAVILSRMLLFTEAKFQWQRLINGRPGDLFGTPTLSLLEVPWPNGTTGDLLARMEQDVSLHGNFYATREGDRIRRLRPDWVEIILDSAPGEAVTTNIVGYLYKPGGSDSSTAPKVYTPQEVAHWAPIPDPLAQYRGMSWLTPVIREMVADRAATDHKLKFFENAATPNLAVSFSENITKDQFNAFMAAMNAAHQGTANAYKTLYLGGGADVKTIGANMDQMDFKNTQGAGETRICAAGGVPPIIVGLSEGLASATYSNYGMARRKFGDHWARPQWRSACAALAVLLDVPSGARLWYDDRDIAFLREDQKDVAAIQSQQATTMKSLVDSGYEPDSVTAAMLNEDWSLLKHTGLFSVQLQPPGTVQKAGAMAAGTGPVAGLPAGGSGPNDTTPAKTAAGGQPTPAAGGQTKSGTATPAKPATPSQPSSATPATPARDTDELAELREQVASLTSLVTDLVTQRTDWTPDAHPREPSGKFAEVPGLDLVASKGKRKGISHNTITAKQWGQKVGHIRLTGEGTEIDDLTVSPKHRGKGIAHRLMQEAIRQHGHNTMRLHASPFGSGGLDSEGLMAFYAKHGFVPEPDRGKGYMVRHPSGGRSAESDGEARGWDEALHPRAPEGSGSGGQFMAYDKSKNQGTGYGKKGGDANVRELQEALNKLGFTDAKGNKLAVDGQLGPLTTAAIMKAQKQLGIKPDGKVDKALLDKIKAMHAPGKPAAHQDHSKAKPGGHPPAAHEDHKGGQPHKPAAHEDHSKAKPKPHGPSAHQDVKGPGDGKFHNAPAHHKPKHKAGPASAHSEVDTGKPKAKPPAKKKPAKPEPPHYQHVEVRPGDRGWWPDDADERASKWTEGKHPRNPDGKFAHLSTAQLAHELGKTNYQLNEPSNQIGAMQKALQAKHKALKTELNKRPDKPAKIPEWTPGTKFTGDAGSPKPATPTPAAPPKPVVPAAPVEPAAPAPKYDLPEYKPKPPKRMPESKTGVSNADEMGLDRDQRKAVREYSGGRYRDVNYTLRGKDWTYSDTQEIIDGLDAVFDKGAKVDRPMTVKRRVMGARLMLGEPGEKVGKTFTDPAFVSTTELADMKNIQGVFGHDEFEIHLPEGTPAFRMGKLSKNTHEKEILLKRGTKFKVLSDKQTPQGRRIKLEVVL